MTRNPRHSRISRMLKNPCIPPKISKPQFRQITLNSPTIFRFEQREMEPSKFTANYAKIAQFATHSRESREIRAILKKNPTNPCSPTVPQPFAANSTKFAHIAKIHSDLREINPFRTNSNTYSTLFFRLS